MNQHLTQLEGITEPRLRAEQRRVYYNGSMLFVDFKKLGFSRDALVKALQAEGVQARYWDYPEQHKLKIYSEAKRCIIRPEFPRRCPATRM